MTPERFDQLVALAKMRLLLADDIKGASQSRTETGQFHEPVADHGLLLAHMSLQHGLAITQAMRGSTRVARAIHDADHAARAANSAQVGSPVTVEKVGRRN